MISPGSMVATPKAGSSKFVAALAPSMSSRLPQPTPSKYEVSNRQSWISGVGKCFIAGLGDLDHLVSAMSSWLLVAF